MPKPKWKVLGYAVVCYEDEARHLHKSFRKTWSERGDVKVSTLRKRIVLYDTDEIVWVVVARKPREEI